MARLQRKSVTPQVQRARSLPKRIFLCPKPWEWRFLRAQRAPSKLRTGVTRSRGYSRTLVMIVTGAILSCPAFAFAAPSTSGVDDFLSSFGLEVRAFAGGSATFGKGFVAGGDAAIAFGGPRFDLLVGARAGSDGVATQFGAFDTGIRYFLRDDRPLGFFIQGDFMLGLQSTDQQLALLTSNLVGAAAEGGFEFPRTSNIRLTTSLRVDLGYTYLNENSRAVPNSLFSMVSLNVGFFLGGNNTRCVTPETVPPGS